MHFFKNKYIIFLLFIKFKFSIIMIITKQIIFIPQKMVKNIFALHRIK